MNEITELNIPPKKIQEKYQGELIEITFDPKIKLWNWQFTIVPHPMTLHGTGFKTPEAAMKEAKHKVDKIVGTV